MRATSALVPCPDLSPAPDALLLVRVLQVRPEWCEEPKAYALRVINQLIDHVVQVRQDVEGQGCLSGQKGEAECLVVD